MSTMNPTSPNPHPPTYRRVERTVTVEHFDDELPEDLRGFYERELNHEDDDELGPDDVE